MYIISIKSLPFSPPRPISQFHHTISCLFQYAICPRHTMETALTKATNDVHLAIFSGYFSFSSDDNLFVRLP